MNKILTTIAMTACVAAFAAETVQLPKPNKEGGMTLMEALSKRSSSRDFKAGSTISKQELSDLLWCANGFNRENKRTAPSAVNAQAVDIYVFDAEGIWLYQPKEQALLLVAKGDNRADTGMQPFVKDAAINLLFVYDKEKWPLEKPTDGKWAAADAAFCAENVYLYCASKELKVVVRGSFNEAKLRQLLNLPESKIIALAQSIGK